MRIGPVSTPLTPLPPLKPLQVSIGILPGSTPIQRLAQDTIEHLSDTELNEADVYLFQESIHALIRATEGDHAKSNPLAKVKVFPSKDESLALRDNTNSINTKSLKKKAVKKAFSTSKSSINVKSEAASLKRSDTPVAISEKGIQVSHPLNDSCSDPEVIRLETSLLTMTRERDELHMRCQHLQSLLQEMQGHMKRQEQEIQVLRQSLSSGTINLNTKSQIPSKNGVSETQTHIQSNVSFSGYKSVPELLETIGALRAELAMTRDQTVPSKQDSTLTTEINKSEFKPNTNPSSPSKKNVSINQEQVLEIEMPSTILRKMKREPMDVSPTMETSQDNGRSPPAQRQPMTHKQQFTLPDLDNMSFVTDALYDEKSMIGSLLDDTEVLDGRSFLDVSFQDSKKQEIDEESRFSSTPIPTLQTKDIVYRSPSKDVISTTFLPHKSADDAFLANVTSPFAKWVPFPSENSLHAAPAALPESSSPTKSFLLRERDALEEELLEKYVQLRHMKSS